jgi:hypothetical protein
MANVAHKFKVGQTVDLIPSVSRLAANGHYQIISVRPSEGDIPHYRIKSISELHERVVGENELTFLRKSGTA